MKVEEPCQDVLQNIESAIVQAYRQEPSLLDYTVLRALEAAIARYSSVRRQQEPKKIALDERDTRVFDGIIKMIRAWNGSGGRSESSLGRGDVALPERAP